MSTAPFAAPQPVAAQPAAAQGNSLPNPRRPKPGTYTPRPETIALLKVSGNAINGVGETAARQASPFFWHSPDQHPFGPLQDVARANSRKCPGSGPAFIAAYTHPELVPVAEARNPAPPAQLSAEATTFALAHEAGAIGIAPMDPLYVFGGYTIDDPWVIILALAPNYERLKQLPSDETNGIGVTEIGEQYARGTRASFALANWIRAQGYNATAYPGPSASALLLIPPAIASGLGELGKHGSLINHQFGAGLRLAGVTTDMPLVATAPVRFGADDFCTTCQICTKACPPGAITESKQLVRGVERWYVNFDKCIPYFAEASSCGICIADCPWTRPDVRPKLLATMAKRLGLGPSEHQGVDD
ncbi:4Fe-4S dicluster domain-containing protein [Granulicella arctica]|uniref:4Fe-4S dicluster domain-containing protein n=1 Tax=Granulicella arctica TaxID=940613 RepID=UPI0021E03216|nr:4Fe-4S dicluster domain-containing protein [Granulicella arctica]